MSLLSWKRRFFSDDWAHYRLAMFFVSMATGAIVGLSIGEPLGGISLGLVAGVLIGSSGSFEATVNLEGIGPEALLNRIGVYIDGKIKRYNLLFAVNGGAFAIASLNSEKPGSVAGMLTLPTLSFGAIIFTAVMVTDIWLWGGDMRRHFVGIRAFTFPGRAILLLIGGLVICGWFLITLPA